MINLPVSESEAFDYLSILHVKMEQGMECEKRYSDVSTAIREQGIKLRDVLTSAEYIELLNANSLCFEAIERAHSDKITASEVQNINHVRFLAKRALQQRFWSDSPLTERKTLG